MKGTGFLLLVMAVSGPVAPTPLRAQRPQRERAADTAYIPIDLNDALDTLQRILSPHSLWLIRDSMPEDMVPAHMGLGLWIRNQWGLWASSRLARYFYALGIHHPDDMSAIILTSLWRRLHHRPVALAAQVQAYRRYWAVRAPPESTTFAGCPAGVNLSVFEGAPRDSTPRFVQLGQCASDSSWWAFEQGRGWYRPPDSVIAGIEKDWSQ